VQSFCFWHHSLYLVTRTLDPDREGPSAVVDALEAGAQRVRHRLRRPYRPHHLNPPTLVTPLIGQSLGGLILEYQQVA
jgi:hypothetical protein